MTHFVAIEGSHCTGKSSLTLALTAELIVRGIRAAPVLEVVRSNPMIEAQVRSASLFTTMSQAQLVGHHILAEQTAGLNADIVICDRSALNVLAYMEVEPGFDEDNLAQGLRQFLDAYTDHYSLIILCHDLFAVDTTDAMRHRDVAWQSAVQEALCRVLNGRAGVRDLPIGLSHFRRVAFVLDCLDTAGLL